MAENATTEELRQLHGMVNMVKHDEEVAIKYMRLWEEEESIRRRALEEGRAQERANTEKEKTRADEAEARADEAEARADEAEVRADEAEKRCEELLAEMEKLKQAVKG